MKWKHILDEQPSHEQMIVRIEPPYEGHYNIRMGRYTMYGSFQEYLDFCDDNELPAPDFWWIAAEDFPFPDKQVL